MKKIAILALKFYRKYLSILMLQHCRFYPSCSQYAIDAIEKDGFSKGIFKSIWRILRCNPFSKGGYDPA
ncbi:MAG: membrane protein insertion efficiency factor YidD [Candidatus Omnitrophica bacterium]|nr:membrane protein insertion efficiency factor YidD [Candidatus Omnitrophota bacterium]